jgi:nucleoside-diphosphate-sugar epimerase
LFKMDKKISKAIVTGGAGFIGSHIVDELLERGIETYVVDNLSTGSHTNLIHHSGNNLLHLVIGDINNIYELMKDVEGIDILFHEAAIADISKSIENPLLVNNVNLTSTLKLMDYCLKQDIRRFVFASSAAVYGMVDNTVVSEDMICKPNTPYAASKYACEAYLHAYFLTYGLETIMLRYFNVFGPRQTYSEYSNVINAFVNRLVQGNAPTIFGDGFQTRDFVYAKDIAQANMLAMEKNDIGGEVFNIASGHTISLNDLLQKIKQITATEDIKHVQKPPRPKDIRFAQASIEKATKLLGYIPKANLDEGLKLTAEYTRNKFTQPNAFVTTKLSIRGS